MLPWSKDQAEWKPTLDTSQFFSLKNQLKHKSDMPKQESFMPKQEFDTPRQNPTWKSKPKQTKFKKSRPEQEQPIVDVDTSYKLTKVVHTWPDWWISNDIDAASDAIYDPILYISNDIDAASDAIYEPDLYKDLLDSIMIQYYYQ